MSRRSSYRAMIVVHHARLWILTFLSLVFFSENSSVLAIPVYLDAVTIIMGAIRSRIRKIFGKTDQEVTNTVCVCFDV